MPARTITRDDGSTADVDTDTGEILPADANPETAVTVAPDGEIIPIPPALAAEFDGMLATVPYKAGDGLANILRQIAGATDVRDLDAPWRTEAMQRLNGIPIVVSDLRRAPSDYDGGLAWFLIVDAVVRATGERITFTTGAVSVVAQLAKAWALGAFPVTVIPRRAERPNARGYFAWHLEMVR